MNRSLVLIVAVVLVLPMLPRVLFAADAPTPATNASPAPAPPPEDHAKKQTEMLRQQPFECTEIFSGETLPKIDFFNPNLVQAAVGSYTLHVRFFDGQWNEVTTAKTPGQYGALIEVKTDSGLDLTRHLNLYRTPQPFSPAKQPYTVTLGFPDAFGISDSTLEQEKWNIADWTNGTLEDATRNNNWATLAASLHDIQADPARWRGLNVWNVNNIWWSELNKRLGANQDYPHLTRLPDGYDKDQKAWPLLIFLHGSGERGNDLNMLKDDGPLGYINAGHPLPFIVVSPQCPENEHWNPEQLARLLDTVEAANRVDPKRVYVTGLSLGGFGTIDFAAMYPGRIAAMASVSGGETPELAQRIKTVPLWLFHGEEDNVVPPRYSINLAHALEKLGVPVKLTLYPGLGHEKWELTYDNPALYTWFLAHSK